MLQDNKRPKREGIILAVPADEGKVERLGPWFYLQRKLNGERCRVEAFHKEPIFMSSYKNPFSFLDHIRDEVKYVWKKTGIEIPFDGEIYKHGWSRERIDSALRRTVNYNKEVEELEYHIFDVNEPLIQKARISIYLEVLKKYPTPHLKAVKTYRFTKNRWMEAVAVFIADGYEGAILRNPFYPTYDPRRLVNQMLKYKPTEEDEYIIQAVKEAISLEGEPKGMAGSFIVCGDDDVPFSVGAGKLSHSKRRIIWENADKYINKTLVVKQGKIRTSEGIPTCAVAVEVKYEA